MSAQVHPTAIVGGQVVLGDDVEVGAYSVIDGQVCVGARTRILHHVSITGVTDIGADNIFFPFSSIGHVAQDTRTEPGVATLKIGNCNTFREYTTINLGSRDQRCTRIGSHNLFMACVHIAHDCQIGDHIIVANNTIVAGHVQVCDRATIGGACAVHQFCRIGQYSMIGGFSRVSHDVPPFVLANGNPFYAVYINRVGLRRAEFGAGRIDRILELFRAFYSGRADRTARLAQLKAEIGDSEDERLFYDFVSAPSRRAVVRRKF